ncbi:MAG: energy transducer TonB [Candidatus Omnitrophota bacterium]
MASERNFQIALVLSLIAHSAILINYPSLEFLPLPKKNLIMKVNYLKNIPQLTEVQKQTLNKKFSARKLPQPSNSFNKGSLVPPSNKENLLSLSRQNLPRNQAAIKPAIIRPNIITGKKKISLSQFESEKSHNQSYDTYYDFVREKIRRAAYQNHNRNEIGEIYLAFIIFSNGTLQDARIIEEKSSLNNYLRDVALRSIKDASPFPSFPQELDYPQLSFNVIISFAVE